VPDLNISELKGVQFGQNKQELAAAIGSHELTPRPDQEKCSIYGCDGLIAHYQDIKFSPDFWFNKQGRLVMIDGLIINGNASTLSSLQSYLDGKLGKAQVNDDSDIWTDGGLKVILSSVGSNSGAFNFIRFRSADF
jgi:hypothetical protein